MYAVITMPKHDTQSGFLNTHIAIGTLGVQLGLVSLTFFLSGYFFITASKEFGEWDGISAVFKRQQKFIVFGLNFTCLQLSHYSLVFIVILVGVSITETGFPVFVRGRSHHEIMLLMILSFVAKLANLNML